MSDMTEVFKLLREERKEKRRKRLQEADPEGWSKYTEYHWYRWLNGHKLDYWPSTGRFQYRGKVMSGGVEGFIAKREGKCQQGTKKQEGRRR